MAPRRTALALVALTAACTEAPPAAPPAPTAPQAAPTPQAPPPASPGPFALPRAEATCRYELQDVLTVTLGGQLAAGHEATVTYALAVAPEDGGLAYTATVERVTLKGKREDYSAKLDSEVQGDMVRVRGGADTLLMFEGILYFALLQRPLTFHVGPAGHLLRVEGAEAVREALLTLHPPKPRQDPHQRAQVAVALSDDGLARRLLPFAALAPQQDTLQPAVSAPAEGQTDFAEYPAKHMIGSRIRWLQGKLLLEEKRAFAPSEGPAKYPARAGFPKEALLRGEDDTTVALTPGDPCFSEAAFRFAVTRSWTGVLQDEELTTEQHRSGTWLHRRLPSP
jgi:hypothetical protein